jgi:hypothetical protein
MKLVRSATFLNQLYARLLQEAYEAAERLAQSDSTPEGLADDAPRGRQR